VKEVRYDGRVAIVTGAGGGLGLQHAKLLAERGASVVLNDIGGTLDGHGTDASAAGKAAATITAMGGVAVADSHSVSTAQGAAALVATAVDTFGTVDILVNNAGILRDKSLLKMSESDFDEVLAVHLRGSFLTTRAAFAHMRQQGYGRIVNTTSPAGLFGNFGQANYSSAKAGLIGLTRTTATEGARYNVLANLISPGAMTRMTEGLVGQLFGDAGAEMLDPARVSPVVAWLVSEACDLTGEILGAVGGLVTRLFIAETAGFYDPHITIESVGAHIHRVLDETSYGVPRSVADSMAALTKIAEAG
jgi:NAD(P)-dependent dehydrogenase (short-subunit alcohol dehydrogenase family)